MGARNRLVVAAGMVLIAVTTLLLHTAFATTWSNHCDPGNVRFNLMANDPMSNFSASGLVVRWENPGPDNSWLCTGATLSYSYIGGNADTVLAEANAAMQSAGWQGSTLTTTPSDGWSFWDKTADGVHLSGLVHKDLAWVEVDLQADPLHLGDSGW
jgi:hypothetical protein